MHLLDLESTTYLPEAVVEHVLVKTLEQTTQAVGIAKSLIVIIEAAKITKLGSGRNN